MWHFNPAYKRMEVSNFTINSINSLRYYIKDVND